MDTKEGRAENGSVRNSMGDGPLVGVDPITLNKLSPVSKVALKPCVLGPRDSIVSEFLE